MPSIFSKIANGEIPSYKVAEDDSFFAFLDIRPLAKGHVLIIPKAETDYFFDIDDSSLAKMIVFAKRVAIAIKKVVLCKRIGIAVIGFEVPHAHIHLVPLNSEADINFKNSRIELTPDEFTDLARKISSEI